jgi:SAM-dependent methyltransferase
VSKLTWPAPERNKQPILEVLQRVLPPSGTLLEVASGTGQHAVHFARNLTRWTIQPSDIDVDNLASIRAWAKESALANLRAPVRIDALDPEWCVKSATAVFNANMIHISPWKTAEGLLRGAGRVLVPGGVFVLYGPFRIAGKHTAPSNEAFDESLSQRDGRLGVRDIEAVIEMAEGRGLAFRRCIPMPANNHALVLIRRS